MPMHRRNLLRLAALGPVPVLLSTNAAQAQGAPPKPAPSATEHLLELWNDAARKVTDLAREFPENKYDYRPTPEVRTFAEQLLHVAFWNIWASKTAKGEKPDPKPNQLSRQEYKTKAAIVDVVKRSFDGAAGVLRGQTPEKAVQQLELWAGFVEHAGEHYGQMVVYYRLNGIVPPESRPKKG